MKIIVEISCVEVWRQISDYVDDDVDPEMKARLEFHFERCRDCKAILDGTRNVVALIGDEQAFDSRRRQRAPDKCSGAEDCEPPFERRVMRTSHVVCSSS